MTLRLKRQYKSASLSGLVLFCGILYELRIRRRGRIYELIFIPFTSSLLSLARCKIEKIPSLTYAIHYGSITT